MRNMLDSDCYPYNILQILKNADFSMVIYKFSERRLKIIGVVENDEYVGHP